MNMNIITYQEKSEETLAGTLARRIKDAREGASFKIGGRGFKIMKVSEMFDKKKVKLSQEISLSEKNGVIEITCGNQKIKFNFAKKVLSLAGNGIEMKKRYESFALLEKALKKVIKTISEKGRLDFHISLA